MTFVCKEIVVVFTREHKFVFQSVVIVFQGNDFILQFLNLKLNVIGYWFCM